MSLHCQYLMPVELCSTDWLNRLTHEASSPFYILTKYFKNITSPKRNISNKNQRTETIYGFMTSTFVIVVAM